MTSMPRRLRVGIVAPAWSEADEGPVLPALQELLWALAGEHELRVVALRYPGGRPRYRDARGVAVWPLGAGTRGGPLGRAAVLSGGIRALRQLHRETPFDVLHGFWADEPGATVVAAGRSLGVPAIVSVMGGELAALADIGYGAALGRGGRWATSVALRGADLIAVGSGSLYRTAAPRAPDVPIRQLPLGVDLTAFAPAARRQDGPPTLLFVGSLTPVKDPVLLLRAFARSSVGGARLMVVGDGPLRMGLERLSRTLRVADRVTFTGPLPRAALPDVYRAADVLVVTSRHEAQSMVVVEAAACGLPVVGTAVGVVPELAAAGGGVSVAVGDVAALTAALDRALLSRSARAAMGAAGSALATRAWGLAGVASAFGAAWEDVIRGR